jgi:hypothetical protein
VRSSTASSLHYSRNAGAFFNLGEPARLDPRSLLPGGHNRRDRVLARTPPPEPPSMLRRRSSASSPARSAIVDRIARGEVIDFLHLHFRDVFHWATFNVADIYITAGLVLLLWDAFRRQKAPAPAGTTEAT